MVADNQPNIRALLRGLDLLRFVNSQGSAKPAEIATAIGVPRPTVYRLLHTLEEAGYILMSASDTRVRVSPRASGLGDNYAAHSHICRVAAPGIAEFTDVHSWPLDLSVYRDLHMVIEETTHWRSPFSIDRNMAGLSLPILRSSAGRAFLAFLEDKERSIILDLLRNNNDPEDERFLLESWIASRLVQYRKQGYATRSSRTFRPDTSSLAVPIICEDRVLGCLSIIWIASAFSMTEAINRYASPMKELANQIAAQMVKGAPVRQADKKI